MGDFDCLTCTRREECPVYEPGYFCTEYSSGKDTGRPAVEPDPWTD